MNESLRAELLQRYLEMARPIVLHGDLVALAVQLAYRDWSALAGVALEALARRSRNGVAMLYVSEDNKGVALVRSTKGVDVASVARHHGGGGGSNQAAFNLPLDKWHALHITTPVLKGNH